MSTVPARYRRPYRPGLPTKLPSEHPSPSKEIPVAQPQPQRPLPNQDHIDRLLKATASKSAVHNVSDSKTSSIASTNSTDSFFSVKSSNSAIENSLQIKVNTGQRNVMKQIDRRMQVSDVVKIMIKEHRLELESEDIVLWICIDNTRRPLRTSESIDQILSSLDSSQSQDMFYQITDGSLRFNPDSLASLVPRRDMLKHPPMLESEPCSFTVPPRGYSLSKLDKLVWGFGVINMKDNQLYVIQKADNKSVCAVSLQEADVYELCRGNGPHQFSCIIRLLSNKNRPILFSTDDLKLFSILRNAVFTARSRYVAMTRKRN